VSVGGPDHEAAAVLGAAGFAVHLHDSLDNATGADPHDFPELVILAAVGRDRRLSEAAAHLHRSGHKIVAVCDRPQLADIRAMLHAGTSGVVLREETRQTLVPTLIAVASGQVCVPQRHAEGADRQALSTREKQVVGLAATGLMNSEIAARLYLAESTVKSHLSSAFAKLGVRSRHEAVEMVVDAPSGIGHP
jgi:DNA-binding NarL/FixJ family response regulator